MNWDCKYSSTILKTPIFDVHKNRMESSTGLTGDYFTIKAFDWVVVIARHDDKFVLVRQYRHGEGTVTMEFPGGIVDSGENPDITAARELQEETGYKAEKMTLLGKTSSNPAIMENHIYYYLAEDLVQTNSQNLDPDEILDFYEVNVDEVIRNFGNDEYTQAFMGTALTFYMRHCAML